MVLLVVTGGIVLVLASSLVLHTIWSLDRLGAADPSTREPAAVVPEVEHAVSVLLTA